MGLLVRCLRCLSNQHSQPQIVAGQNTLWSILDLRCSLIHWTQRTPAAKSRLTQVALSCEAISWRKPRYLKSSKSGNLQSFSPSSSPKEGGEVVATNNGLCSLRLVRPIVTTMLLATTDYLVLVNCTLNN